MYNDLCKCCAKPKDKCTKTKRRRSSARSSGAPGNRFADLNIEETPIVEQPPSTELELCAQRPSDRGKDVGKSDDTTPSLMDDSLGEMLELREAVQVNLSVLPLWLEVVADRRLQEIDGLLEAVSHAWEQAARDEIPLHVATTLTNVASTAFEEIEQRLKVSCNVHDPHELRDKFARFSCLLGEASTRGREIDDSLGGPVQLLSQSWDLLLQCKQEYEAHGGVATFTQNGAPTSIVFRKNPESAAEHYDQLQVMLRNIKQHIVPGYLTSSIVSIRSPVYAEVGYLLAHDEPPSNGLRCCFGLQLLLQICRTFFFESRPSRLPSSCRLEALRTAQTALKSIRKVLKSPTMPCRCQGTLAYHLENVQTDLEGFLRARVFDLYFQSPWVSGSHVLEIHDILFYYGLRLFSYKTYVGSVLHVYNILRQFTDMAAVPLCDRLIETFAHALFPGGIPSRSFRTCYIRYLGGRLRFNTHRSKHRSGCHSMAIPAHAASATAGFGKRSEIDDPILKYRKVSLLYHIKNTSGHLDTPTWEAIRNSADTRSSPPSSPKACTHHSRAHSILQCPQTQLKKVQEALCSEYSGDLPIAKVNLLEVYLAFEQVVAKLSDKSHGEHARPDQYCLCFVDSILSAADRYRDSKACHPVLGHKELVKDCREAINDQLGSRDLRSFWWDNA